MDVTANNCYYVWSWYRMNASPGNLGDVQRELAQQINIVTLLKAVSYIKRETQENGIILERCIAIFTTLNLPRVGAIVNLERLVNPTYRIAYKAISTGGTYNDFLPDLRRLVINVEEIRRLFVEVDMDIQAAVGRQTVSQFLAMPLYAKRAFLAEEMEKIEASDMPNKIEVVGHGFPAEYDPNARARIEQTVEFQVLRARSRF